MKLYIALLTGEEDAVLADKLMPIEKTFADNGSFGWEVPHLEVVGMVKKAEEERRYLIVDRSERLRYNNKPVEKSDEPQGIIKV